MESIRHCKDQIQIRNGNLFIVASAGPSGLLGYESINQSIKRRLNRHTIPILKTTVSISVDNRRSSTIERHLQSSHSHN